MDGYLQGGVGNTFGGQREQGAPQGQWGGQGAWKGAGGNALPGAFAGWGAGARYAFSPANSYSQGMQPTLNHFKNQMGKDYSKQLFGQSQEVINSQFKQAGAQRKQAAVRSGSMGSAGVSPMMQYQLQNEAQARSGALGEAARASVLQAEQMQNNAARGYQDSLANIYQAYMAPAYLQNASIAQVPVGQSGPSLVGPAMNTAAAGLNLFA